MEIQVQLYIQSCLFMKMCQNKQSPLTETKEGSVDVGIQLKPLPLKVFQCLFQIQLLKVHVRYPGI